MANDTGRNGRTGGFYAPNVGGEPKPFAVPRPQTGTVVIKLKTGASVVRRFNAAIRGTAMAAAGPPVPVLESLIANGYIEEADPVFPTKVSFAGPRRATMGLAASVVEAPANRKHSRGLVTLTVARGTSPQQLAEHLNAQGNEIEYAYIPPEKHTCAAAKAETKKKKKKSKGDPLFSRQWGHGAVKILAARTQAGFREAAGIIVAIVDSGVDITHPDLDGAIAAYENFLSAHEDDRDAVGHGTHVAGIIAAERNNAVGIAGLCAARLHSYKGLPREGVAWDAAAYYRALARPLESGARVLNLSLGGGFDPGEEDIVRDLIEGGVVVVAAMGNEFTRGNPISYPAAYAGVIAVGATDEMDRRGSFSNTGPHIALCAPGVRILSTVPRYPTENSPNTTDYDSWDGTSMATPYVAAAVALMLAKRSALTPAQVRARLMATADRVPGQTGFNEQFGAGRLNIASALRGL